MTEERNEIMELNNETGEVYDEDGNSGRGFGKVLLGAALLVGAGVGAAIYKNKSKLEEKRIEKLRKKGYIIYHEDDVEEVVDVDDDENPEAIAEIKEKVKEKVKEKKE